MAKRAATLEHSALRYLDQWFRVERSMRERLSKGATEDKLAALRAAAGFYKVARGFPTKYDEGKGLRRFEPLLPILFPASRPNRSTVVALVEATSRRISAAYGGASALSASSKLLWLCYRDPVVILDSQARKALAVGEGDYGAYVRAWEVNWKSTRQEAKAVCHELPSVLRFARCSSEVSVREVEAAVRSRWFQRRVVDIQLWLDGAS